MSATELLADLSRRGIELWVEGERLRFRAPEGALTPVLREAIGARRNELLELLRESARPTSRTASEGQGRILPLSLGQQRLWFVNQLQPETPFLTVPISLDFEGTLDMGVLQRALTALVRRHEALRTALYPVEGQLSQVIAPASEAVLQVVELDHLPAEERARRAASEAEGELDQVFDLERGPLVRFTLLKFGPEHARLLVTLHHIVTDAWSNEVIVRELSALYRAFAAGKADPLPPLPLQPGDEALRERTRLQDEPLRAQLSWWRERLQGMEELRLPTDFTRPAVQSFHGDVLRFSMSPALTEPLARLAREEQATAFMTMLAGFYALLARLTGQEDLVVGSHITGRSRPELAGLVGFFVQNLVLRLDASGNPSFRELVRRVRTLALGAYEHADIPFERILEELKVERHRGKNPLFQTTFALQQAPLPATHVPGVTTIRPTPAILAGRWTRFDLELHVWEEGGAWHGGLVYSTDLFEGSTIRRTVNQFQRLLEAALDDPSRRLSELPLLSEDEEAQLVSAPRVPPSRWQSGKGVHQLVSAQAARSPRAPAVVSPDGGILTYGELETRANRLANHLRSLGVGPEARVGLCLERSADLVVCLLGILKAGAAYVPLDPEYPAERLALMCEDAGIEVLVTDSRHFDAFRSRPVKAVLLDQDAELLARAPSHAPEVDVSLERLAYLMYTSGSTGTPKGIGVVHRAILNLVLDTEYVSLGTQDAVAQASNTSFDASTFEIWGALLNGARLVILPRETTLDPDAMEQALVRHGVTTLFVTTALFQQLTSVRPTVFQSLRVLLFGGQVVDPLRVQQVLEEGCPQRLLHVYGPTECTTFSSFYPVRSLDSRKAHVSIGRALDGASLYVLDKRLRPVPYGVIGELYIGGSGVARGYHNRPALTAERFLPDPFASEPGARMYRTGDLVCWRVPGNLEFHGRVDQQVKIRGYRIEPGEIEATLSKHPGVRQVAVVVREDTPGDPRLVAYVVPHGALTPADLHAYLATRLPGYMVPAAFVLLDALPLTPNGKLDVRRLEAPPEAGLARPPYVAPLTEREQALATIWQEVLRVERVGRDDDFFQLGGDSILGILVISRASQKGIGLTPRQLFDAPVLRNLAASAREAGPKRAEQGLVRGPVELTPIQRWFFEQGLPEPHHFNQARMLEVPADFVAVELGSVVRRLLEHHDALRLRFERAGDQWRQRIAPLEGRMPVMTLLLDEDTPGRHPEEILEFAVAAQRGMNLAEGPLFRAVHFHRGPRLPGRLLLVIHHLAVDAVSWSILLEDLERLLGPEPVQLPAKTTSFRAWSEALTRAARSEATEAERPYWLNVAKALRPTLPVDHAEGEDTQDAEAVHTVELDPELTRQLLQAAPAAYGMRVDEVLLTSVLIALHRWSGASTLGVALENHGREEVAEGLDVSRTVGWFTTLFPAMLRLEGAGEPGAALRGVKDQLRAVPRRGLGYGLLRYLSPTPPPELVAAPEPDLRFNYLGRIHPPASDTSRLTFTDDPVGPMWSDKGRRRYLLALDAMVVDDRLRLLWSWSRRRHEPGTISRFADGVLTALRELIAHCRAPGAGGYTVSDFPDVDLSQDELEAVLAEVDLGEGKA
ncbi:non-ribosomal peptide synthetase [Hyalangium gracile]|uniref:non-ribosomal peptide synthetase n=1 Tax=Hyalangium gracile TaxID=394092 RepID=UPI001CCD34F4|nr:non-ribosomal peptide synthetase [Hyalangium gracile]